MENHQQEDHDLLIEVNSKVGFILNELKEIKDGNRLRLERLEERMNKVENRINYYAGALAVFVVLSQVIINWFIR